MAGLQACHLSLLKYPWIPGARIKYIQVLFYFSALTWLAASEHSQAMTVWLPRVSVP